MATAAIPVRMAPVAVKEDLQGRAVPDVIIASIEFQSVPGANGNFPVGYPLHDMADAKNVFRDMDILITLHGVFNLRPVRRRGIEGSSVSIPSAKQYGSCQN